MKIYSIFIYIYSLLKGRSLCVTTPTHTANIQRYKYLFLPEHHGFEYCNKKINESIFFCVTVTYCAQFELADRFVQLDLWTKMKHVHEDTFTFFTPGRSVICFNLITGSPDVAWLSYHTVVKTFIIETVCACVFEHITMYFHFLHMYVHLRVQ